MVNLSKYLKGKNPLQAKSLGLGDVPQAIVFVVLLLAALGLGAWGYGKVKGLATGSETGNTVYDKMRRMV